MRTISSRAAAIFSLSISPTSSLARVARLCRKAWPTGLRKGSSSAVRKRAVNSGYNSTVLANHGSTIASACMGLHATGRFWQPGKLASTLGWPRREQLISLVQREPGLFAELAHHRRDSELNVVIADVVDHLPVLFRERLDPLAVGKVLRYFVAPAFGLLHKAVFIDFVLSSFHFECRHLSPPRVFRLLVHFDITAGACIGALLATVAELHLHLVVLAFRQFHEPVVGAVHPAGFTIHAHPAGHAALGFFKDFGLGETKFDFRIR